VASRLFGKAHPAWPVFQAPDFEEQVHRQNVDLNLKCIRVLRRLSNGHSAYNSVADKLALRDYTVLRACISSNAIPDTQAFR